MKYMKIKLIVLLLNLGLTVHAQQATVSAGGFATGTEGTVSYSIGQIVYTSATGSNGSVAQGVQQTYQITAVTGVENTKEISLVVSAYPNPTKDIIILNVGASTPLTDQLFIYKLIDMNGKVVETQKIVDVQTTIEMNHLMPATYFLNVEKMLDGKDQQEVKTFKITKN